MEIVSLGVAMYGLDKLYGLDGSTGWICGRLEMN